MTSIWADLGGQPSTQGVTKAPSIECIWGNPGLDTAPVQGV
jgi:hypothetical protein